MEARVVCVNSNRSGRPVFLVGAARAMAQPFGATSEIPIAATSQPRRLLSTARLNRVRSRRFLAG